MKFTRAILSIFSAAVFGILLLSLTAVPAQAATTITTTFNVSAAVQSACTVAATAMGFGNYTPTLPDNTSTSTVTVTCTTGTTYTVGLDKGANGGSTITRQMKSGANLLNYFLYSGSASGPNWGDTAILGWIPGTGTGIAQQLTVYGKIPTGQYVTSGLTYNDTITASVIY